MPVNFRTYEAQSRLLAAVVASIPGEVKLNYSAIAQHFGSDITASGLEHRFRPVKKQVAVLRSAVAQGCDPKDYPELFTMNEKDIAKYFGESTAQGVEFQFRAVRKDAKKLKEVADAGGDTATALTPKPAASGPSTPAKRKATASATPRTGGTGKRSAKKAKVEITTDSDDDAAGDVNTPTKARRATTASQTPAAADNAAIANNNIGNDPLLSQVSLGGAADGDYSEI